MGRVFRLVSNHLLIGPGAIEQKTDLDTDERLVSLIYHEFLNNDMLFDFLILCILEILLILIGLISSECIRSPLPILRISRKKLTTWARLEVLDK